MMRRFLTLALAFTLLGCVSDVCAWDAGSPAPPVSTAMAITDTGPPVYVRDRGAPDRPEPVWGAADLHAHPAGHLGLGGGPDGRGGVLFGTPESGGLERGRITLGPEDSCDGETHSRGAADPATRLTQSLVFAFFGTEGHRAHAPMYARSLPQCAGVAVDDPGIDAGGADAGWAIADARSANGPFAHWPHAQDLYHQQMFIPAIRRAWEGGLRLMFAAVSDTQSVSRIMRITLAPGELAISQAEERASALREVGYIEDLVARPGNEWMEIAYSPDQAREIIRRGHLALVLSLEMDYLTLEDVEVLHRRGFRHIIPIHVVDNEVGGAAAYSTIFDMHNALFQRAVHPERGFQFYSVISDPCIEQRLGSPFNAELKFGLLFFPNQAGLLDEWTLGYADRASQCSLGEPYALTGTRNRLGLGAGGEAYLTSLMERGMIIDMSHMSIASANDTMTLAERLSYPIIAGHGPVPHPGERVGQDRSLPFDIARRVYRNHGVVGLGTGGGLAREIPAPTIDGRLFTAQGSWHLRPGDDQVLALSQADQDTAIVAPIAGTGDEVCLRSGADAGTEDSGVNAASGFLRVRSCGAGHDSEINLALHRSGSDWCTGAIPAVADASVASIAFQAARPTDEGRCEAATTAPEAPVLGAYRPRDGGSPGADAGVDELPLPVHEDAAVGLAGSFDLARGECTRVYQCDQPASAIPVTPAITPVPPSATWLREGDVRILRVTGHGTSNFDERVRGASFAYAGVDVRLTIDRQFRLPGTAVWQNASSRTVSLNHRGLWLGETELHEYLLFTDVPRDADLRVPRVTVSLTNDDAGGYEWTLANLTIVEIEDPILAWADSYARLRREIGLPRAGASERDGHIAPGDDEPLSLSDVVFALGTDLNGYAPMFPISGIEPDMSRYGGEFLVCDDESDQCTPLRLRERGMANYAMLADFFEALRHNAQGVRAAVLSSAEATIRVWELAEARAREMRGESP